MKKTIIFWQISPKWEIVNLTFVKCFCCCCTIVIHVSHTHEYMYQLFFHQLTYFMKIIYSLFYNIIHDMATIIYNYLNIHKILQSTTIRKSFNDWRVKYHGPHLLKIWRPCIFVQNKLTKIGCIIYNRRSL
jgi:hypothetical protein